ncbi:hypothetical protein ERJ75_000946800 [Trypanosoma vivax]|uniref:SKP1 component dimerisation domain-containing protein n=1 Tax=Trypanosoma vivax (strain Y486) TaxID=1055687 RepID=G0U4H0_TRYVY|nr:hypothetical protein TRVL_01805 [Trypanosoma vivax]KAH8611256.1 hypothetical protein ERJ75_000946800 [Trypanosoma vivax]CCC52334.1 conserved hypothetical protein [Trypanosoma vivax Y486]
MAFAVSEAQCTNEPVESENQLAPLFVCLDANSPLPSNEYLRVIAVSSPQSSDLEHVSTVCNTRTAGKTQNTSKVLVANEPLQLSDVSCNSLNEYDTCDASEKPYLSGDVEGVVVRHEFALHVRGARHCRRLEAMLDKSDLYSGCGSSTAVAHKTSRREKDSEGLLPSVMLKQATRRGCEAVFAYLELITVRLPTTLGKPLRAPLEELVQMWELDYLLTKCMSENTSNAIKRRLKEESKLSTNGQEFRDCQRAVYFQMILEGAPHSLDLLLEVAMLSDFLLIEPLRQLTCAFVASLALNVSSEAELLQLAGLPRLMTEEELGPLYEQFPFMRPDTCPNT